MVNRYVLASPPQPVLLLHVLAHGGLLRVELSGRLGGAECLLSGVSVVMLMLSRPTPVGQHLR